MKHKEAIYKRTSWMVTIHVFAWFVITILPIVIMMRPDDDGWSSMRLLQMLGSPILLAVIFYANYCWLVPKVLLQERIKRFFCFNICLFAITLTLMNVWMNSFMKDVPPIEHPRKEMQMHPHGNVKHREFKHADAKYGKLHKKGKRKEQIGSARWWVFQVRDLTLFAFVAALALTIQLSLRYRSAQLAREQAERGRSEAELMSLRNQISPHFLLNTLNNIYALVAFDQEKAQQAIQDLSRLLSHMLYQGHDSGTVTLAEEYDFLLHYTKLMKIRLSDSFSINLQTNVTDASTIRIAPLIFISLLENAFKHGVAPEGSGFINIVFNGDSETGEVTFRIENSNHPKDARDKSGHGIGLTLVQRRLDLLYPDRYVWEKGLRDNNTYFSSLTIQTS